MSIAKKIFVTILTIGVLAIAYYLAEPVISFSYLTKFSFWGLCIIGIVTIILVWRFKKDITVYKYAFEIHEEKTKK